MAAWDSTPDPGWSNEVVPEHALCLYRHTRNLRWSEARLKCGFDRRLTQVRRSLAHVLRTDDFSLFVDLHLHDHCSRQISLPCGSRILRPGHSHRVPVQHLCGQHWWQPGGKLFLDAFELSGDCAGVLTLVTQTGKTRARALKFSRRDSTGATVDHQATSVVVQSFVVVPL